MYLYLGTWSHSKGRSAGWFQVRNGGSHTPELLLKALWNIRGDRSNSPVHLFYPLQLTSYYMVLVNSPSSLTIRFCCQWRAAPCLNFPGPQNSSQIRVHPPTAESHHTSSGFGQEGGGTTMFSRVFPSTGSQNKQRRLPARPDVNG